MKATKQMVKAILEKAQSYKWSIQGLGMLRLYLSDDIRLHVWDDSFRVQSVSPLHDHPWDFHSTVIAGVVRQFRYTERPAISKEEGYDEFNCATIKCGEGACTVEEPKKVWLIPWYEKYKEDQSYTQLKHEIHESFPEPGTVTLIERTFHENRDNARVFWRGNSDFVSAEPRRATPEEVEAITRNSLKRWF